MSRILRLAAFVLAFSLLVTSCDSKKSDAPGSGAAASGSGGGASASGSGGGAAPMVKPPAMLDLMPEGSVGVVYIASLKGAEDAIKRLVATGSPDQADKVKIGDLAAMSGMDPADLDLARGAAIAMVLPKNPKGPPDITAIVPVKDEKGAPAKMKAGNPGAAVETAGGFAAVSPMGNYKKGGIPARLAGPLPQGDVVLRLDAEALVKAYGPAFFGKARETIEGLGARAPGGGDAMAGAKAMLDGMQSGMEAASVIDLALRSTGTMVELDLTVTFADRSKPTFLEAFPKGDLAKVARGVPDGGMFDVATTVDIEKLWPSFAGFMKTALETYPPEARAQIQKLFDRIPALFKTMGHGMAMSASMTPAGLSGVATLETPDAGAYLKAASDLYAGLELKDSPMVVSPIEDRTVEGAKVKSWKIKIDADKFAPTAGADPAQIKGMLEGFFGKDGMTFHAVDLGHRAVIVIGGDDVLKNAITSVKSDTQGSLSKALAAAGPETTGYLRYDMRAIMSMVAGTMKAQGMKMQVPPGEPVNLNVIMNAGTSQFRARVSADVGKFVALFKEAMPK